MMTEFGGAVAVPSAVRNSDNTTTMRVNDVIMIRIDGATDNTVNSAINWIARSVTPPLPWPPPRLMLMSCANAGAASNPAAIRVTRNKTLRGGPAALTKDSSGAPTGRPFRLRGFQTRSLKGRQRTVAPPARCGKRAARAPPAAQPLRPPAGEGPLQAVAPSPRDFDRPKTSRALEAAGEVAARDALEDALGEPAAWVLRSGAGRAASWVRFAVACGARAKAQGEVRDARPSVRAQSRPTDRPAQRVPAGVPRRQKRAVRGAAAARAFAARHVQRAHRARRRYRSSRQAPEVARCGSARRGSRRPAAAAAECGPAKSSRDEAQGRGAD